MGVDKAYFQEKLAGRGGAPEEERIKKAINAFKKHAPQYQRLLDIGCDDGRICIDMKNAIKAKEACGIEIFEPSCRSSLSRGIKCIKMDIDKNNFPFPDHHFDAIFCGEIIEHLFDPDHLLDEIHRTLSPDGICVLDTPNLASLINRLALFFGYQPFRTAVSLRYVVGTPIIKGVHSPDHIRVFTYRALKELLLLHKFQIVSSLGIPALGINEKPLPFFIRAEEKISAAIPATAHTMMFVFKRE